MTLPPAQWQCVLVCWGDKYNVDVVNRLVSSVERHCLQAPRFVLITDRDRDGLKNNILSVRFPDNWLEPAFVKAGCQAKLAMFEKGVLPTDMPAIYIDLDTIVLGEMSQLLKLLKNKHTIAILQSAVIPFGIFARTISRLTGGKKFARGNSSVLVFHPAHCHYIASTFMRLFYQYPDLQFRPMIADDRFISWAAVRHVRAIPCAFVAKFPTEYMFYWAWCLYIKASLPWVRRRRRAQLAVTLNGLMIKPEKLLNMPCGGIIADEKQRKLVWSERTLGPMKETIIRYYSDTFA